MFAVSIRLMPASIARCRMAVDAAGSARPPNEFVPSPIAETFTPVRPMGRYFIRDSSPKVENGSEFGRGCCVSFAGGRLGTRRQCVVDPWTLRFSVGRAMMGAERQMATCEIEHTHPM